METKLAIELKNPSAFKLAVAIWPHLKELNYEEIRGHFLVFGLDSSEQSPEMPAASEVFSLVGPGWIAENVEHITNASAWVTMKDLHLK